MKIQKQVSKFKPPHGQTTHLIFQVAMLVPTVPLVEQQCIMLNTYLRKKYWIEGMSGSEPVDEHGRAPYVLGSDVTIFTPQIFM